jgi:arsenite-transporting ATPase
MDSFNVKNINLTKYLFFTGKGGVGKTSVACAVAVTLADEGKKVLLVSTDPASNLQDVFEKELSSKGVRIDAVPNLLVANLDPIQAAAEYKENVVAPYRGKLPDAVIQNMEEQLSGACTVEIAAFNEFSAFLADQNTEKEFDYIVFDTAPTGHTLRMLQLPSAWSGFISENTHGASCLGQLSGLESKKELYAKAMATLANGSLTTLMLVSTPEKTSLLEARRASHELSELGVSNQRLIINGVLDRVNEDDETETAFYNKQQAALASLRDGAADMPVYAIPLRSYNITGIENIRRFLDTDDMAGAETKEDIGDVFSLDDVVEDLYTSGKKVVFTMGKGGVGKTSIAAALAYGLSNKGVKVHLATTDPAAHLKYVVNDDENLSVSSIDEQEELAKYKADVLAKARETMGDDDLAYIEEDLRSPCTQEIAVFRAFAELVERSEDETVVIDTAPTGHTLLLLDSTQSYHREIERSKGEVSDSVSKLLPRLRNEAETQVIIVTLAEATPVYEAGRLSQELERAGIKSKWWVINKSLAITGTKSVLLMARAANEIPWIKQVGKLAESNVAVIPWLPGDIGNESLKEFFKNS